jgi:hypothetical protein
VAKKGNSSLEDFRQGLADEWGVYVANQPIMVGNALAFDTGHAVPVSHVTRGVVREDQVTMRSDVVEPVAASPAGNRLDLPGANDYSGERPVKPVANTSVTEEVKK